MTRAEALSSRLCDAVGGLSVAGQPDDPAGGAPFMQALAGPGARLGVAGHARPHWHGLRRDLPWPRSDRVQARHRRCAAALGTADRSRLAGRHRDDMRRRSLQQIQAEDAGRLEEYARSVREAGSLPLNGFCMARGDWQRDVHAVAVADALLIDGETLVFNCGVPAVLLGPQTLEAGGRARPGPMVREVERACRDSSARPSSARPLRHEHPRPTPDKQFADTLAAGLELLLSFTPDRRCWATGSSSRAPGWTRRPSHAWATRWRSSAICGTTRRWASTASARRCCRWAIRCWPACTLRQLVRPLIQRTGRRSARHGRHQHPRPRQHGLHGNLPLRAA